MGPKACSVPIRLSNVPLKAAMILKQEMLAKGGEAALPVKASCLCIEECPVILTGTVRQLPAGDSHPQVPAVWPEKHRR